MKYNAESNVYYTENFSLDANRNIMIRTMSIRDRDGIFLLCKLLARFSFANTSITRVCLVRNARSIKLPSNLHRLEDDVLVSGTVYGWRAKKYLGESLW